jgi:GR25 family glycosyltransferase involved in LPS biosynthesis
MNINKFDNIKHFSEIFDNIYVINLKESIDRKNHIENEFNRVGIKKYQIFEATHYDSDEAKKIYNSELVKKFPNCFRCNKKRCDCENNFLTPYQIGNWCSFLNVFADIIKNNYQFVLICEDDIVFTKQYERIINKLLSKTTFNQYKIDMEKPLLIRFGTAFNPNNHNSNTNPIFLKNFSLCNPCFAINQQMTLTYLNNLKIIDYHSDVYFHQKIPKNIPGIQYFTMHPYPVYELSYVKEKQKFESTIRPKNQLRRLEYKDFLLLSSNFLLNNVLINFGKHLNLDIHLKKMGFHGNINYFVLLNDFEKSKYYFQYKFLFYDNNNDDIKILYYFIKNSKNIKNDRIYNLYLLKINEKFNQNINFDDENDDKYLENIVLFYKYYTKLFNDENIKKININDDNEIKFIGKYYNIEDKLINDINNYNNFKKILFLKIENEKIDTFIKNI